MKAITKYGFYICFILIYNIIILYIVCKLFKHAYDNIHYFPQSFDYYISYQINDNKYIDYYLKNISISSDLDNLSYKTFLYKNYKTFCYCKNKNNTNYKVYDKNICLNLKDCDTNFLITNNDYNLGSISIWNRQHIYFNKQRYNFFQGIKNGACDKNFNYKTCGYLIDLNVNFCVKSNEICPFNNISFYLHNLTSDIIMIYDDKKMNIFENYELKDFFPNASKAANVIHPHIINSSNLFNLVYDNNISFLSEIITNETMKSIKIDLSLLNINSKDITSNNNIFKETTLIQINKKYPLFILHSLFIFEMLFVIYLSFSIYVEMIILIILSISIISVIIMSIIKIFFFGILILICSYFYYYVKIDYDKDYLLNDNYYNLLKDIEIAIKNFSLILLLSHNNIFLMLIIKIFSSCKCITKLKLKKNSISNQQSNETNININNSEH